MDLFLAMGEHVLFRSVAEETRARSSELRPRLVGRALGVAGGRRSCAGADVVNLSLAVVFIPIRLSIEVFTAPGAARSSLSSQPETARPVETKGQFRIPPLVRIATLWELRLQQSGQLAHDG